MNTIPQNKLNVNEKFMRKCPLCNIDIFHSNKYNCNIADKKQQICRMCNMKKRSVQYIGMGNPFYGKKHSKKTIEKILKNRDISIWKTDGFRKKMSDVTSGKNNPMYGKSVYDIWFKKYGKEIADQKQLEASKKKSKNSSGKNNPMYGKPSPKGSGQGWKGYYKKHFFRSLRELSYMIYLDENNIKWKSAELKIYSTEYIDYKGTSRTTRPDFILNTNELIEIKPLRLHTSPSVITKKIAMEQFCKLNNYSYKLMDFEINISKIKNELENGNVEFIKNYREKFLNYINK